MPHAKRAGSGKGRWESYNRHRAAHRALDRQRRLERAAEWAAAYVAQNAVPAVHVPKLGKPWAVVRVDFASGRTATLRTHLGPFGLTRSATRLAAWLRREIQFEQARRPCGASGSGAR